jgi:Ca2+-transporting ATPase
MRRPPSRPNAPLIPVPRLIWSLAQGTIGFIVVAGIYLAGLRAGLTGDAVRSIAFTALVGTVVVLVTTNLGRARAGPGQFGLAGLPPLFSAAAVAAGLLLLLYWPPAATTFHFGPVTGGGLAMASGGVALVFLLLVILERVLRGRVNADPPV